VVLWRGMGRGRPTPHTGGMDKRGIRVGKMVTEYAKLPRRLRTATSPTLSYDDGGGLPGCGVQAAVG
jgi:hypothetical protein